MYLHCTRMFIITARRTGRSYASAVLGVVILSVCPSVTRVLYCFVINPKIKEPTGDIFIPHFNYSKHAVENGLSSFQVAMH